MNQDQNQNQDQNAAKDGGAAAEVVPMMQRLLDSPYLLLALGLAVPTVLYLLWGVMEIAQIPIAK
jgi:hypothetical protein